MLTVTIQAGNIQSKISDVKMHSKWIPFAVKNDLDKSIIRGINHFRFIDLGHKLYQLNLRICLISFPPPQF